MHKRIFVVSRLWYDDHEINSIVVRIFTEENKVIEFIKEENSRCYMTSGGVQWWRAESHPIDLGSKNDYKEDDFFRPKIYDLEGNERDTRPTPHGKYKPTDHRDVCKICMNEEVLAPVMKHLGIKVDPGGEVELWNEDIDAITITGRRAPNGHQVALDQATKYVYVKEEDGGYIVREKPGGTIEGKFIPA